MREKKGANRIETNVWTVWELTYEWPLARSFFCSCTGGYRSFFRLFLFGLSAHWFRSISHAVARSFFLSPNSRLALSFLCPLHSLACFIYYFIADAKHFLTVFRASRCRAAFMGGPAMLAHSLARLLCTPRSHGTVIGFLEHSALTPYR